MSCSWLRVLVWRRGTFRFCFCFLFFLCSFFFFSFCNWRLWRWPTSAQRTSSACRSCTSWRETRTSFARCSRSPSAAVTLCRASRTPSSLATPPSVWRCSSRQGRWVVSSVVWSDFLFGQLKLWRSFGRFGAVILILSGWIVTLPRLIWIVVFESACLRCGFIRSAGTGLFHASTKFDF